MKHRSFKHRLSYFFTQRLHGRNPDSKPETEWERTKSVIEDILRWAKNGGKMLDLGNRPNNQVRPDPDAAQKQANE